MLFEARFPCIRGIRGIRGEMTPHRFLWSESPYPIRKLLRGFLDGSC